MYRVEDEYEGKCGACTEYTFEGDNKKGYCSKYGQYYYPDDTCSTQSDVNRISGSICWLTTACCEYKGLKDNCFELTELRNFRDNILINMPKGKEMIELYYSEGERIVKQIEKTDNKNEIYEYIYNNIKLIIDEIHNEKYEKAVIDYLYMTYKIDLISQGNKTINL